MQATKRIEFFRTALAICARHGRSPQGTFKVNGQEVTLRQVLKTIGGGARVPRITEAEARELARESEAFTYREILTGLSGHRPASRSSRSRSRRPGAVGSRASL